MLARPTSKATYPSTVKVTSVDFNSISSLTPALQGQDAVVSVLPSGIPEAQFPLIDAAIAAGVHRFIPSEFGGDGDNAKTQALPFFQSKAKVAEYLHQKAQEGQITYTLFACGAMLDWGLKVGFLANFQPGGTFNLHDGGDRPFAATTLTDIGRGVAGVLKHPEETRNRTVRVKSVLTTNNTLLAIGRKVNPNLDVKTVHVSTEQLEKEGREVVHRAAETGEEVPRAVFGYFTRRALYGEGYGGDLEPDDDELLGIRRLSDEELEALVAPFAKAS